MKSALTSKVQSGELIVLDDLSFSEVKTKEMVKVLNNINAASKALLVLPEKNNNVYLSARNISGVETTFVDTLNVYSILKYESLVATKDAIAKIEEVYA